MSSRVNVKIVSRNIYKGNVTLIVVPTATCDCTLISPLCLLTISLTMAKPKPVPLAILRCRDSSPR